MARCAGGQERAPARRWTRSRHARRQVSTAPRWLRRTFWMAATVQRRAPPRDGLAFDSTIGTSRARLPLVRVSGVDGEYITVDEHNTLQYRWMGDLALKQEELKKQFGESLAHHAGVI